MRIALFGFHSTVAALAADALRSSREGFDGFYMHNGLVLDAHTALVHAAATVTAAGRSIDLGAAVVPIQTRHPYVMAQEALTANEAASDRFVLGLGLSHPFLVRGRWGLPFERPGALMAEYLDVLLALLDDREVDHDGERYSVHARLELTAPRPRVLLAALGPRMLGLAGGRADGTITWMVGPRTLRSFTVPALRRAAAAARRPAPAVVAGVAVCVTSDVAGARQRLGADLGRYGDMPSYRAMLQCEGVSSPADVCLIGSAAQVADGVHGYGSSGVTQLLARPCGTPREQEDTRALLAGIAQEAAAGAADVVLDTA